MRTERNQEGIHNPCEGRPKAPQRGERCGRDNPLCSCHRRGRSEAENTLTMISHVVEISIAGGGADEKAVSRLKLASFLYTPVCNTCSEWHSIAHVRQTIVPVRPFRNLVSTMSYILIQLKYSLDIPSATWMVRNRKVKSCVSSVISHVRSCPIAGTNRISMRWTHEPIPF